jgi:uncharacterized membrane protein
MEVLRVGIHYGLHLLFPGLIAYVFFKKQWKKAWLLMLLTMLIDIDHLAASPVFDAQRCSINFHSLHGYIAFGAYLAMLFFDKARILAIGLLLHLFTDAIDCLWL